MADNKTKIIIETESGNSEQKLKKIADSVQNISKQTSSMSSSIKTSTKNMSADLALLVGKFAAVAASAKVAFATAREAANFQEVSLYAKNAAESIGLNFDAMVKASQRGANGMASNMVIMKANLKALKGGFRASADDFEKLWKIADATGDELGQSIEQTFEQITNAITTGNARSLISMGLLPESFKRAGDGADLLSKRAELLKTVLDQLGEKADKVGSLGDTSADAFNKLDTAVQNLKTSAGELLVPALEKVVTALTEIINTGNKAIGVAATAMGLRENANPYAAMTTQQLEELQRQAQIRISDLKIKLSPISSSDPSNSYRSSEKNTAEAGLDRQNNLAALYAEKRALSQINEALEKSRQLDEARAETEKKVAEEAERVAKIAKDDEAKKAAMEALKRAQEQAREAERLLDRYADLNKTILPEFSGKESDAYDLMVKISAAAGGIGTAFMKSDKELEAFNRHLNDTLSKMNDSVVGSFISDTAEGKFKSKNYGDQIKGLYGAMSSFGAFDGLGNIVAGSKKETAAETIKKGYVSVRQMLHEDLSDAVVSGITNSNIGEAMRNMVSSIASAKANSYGSTLLGGLFGGKGFSGLGGAVSGFVGSIAISAIANNWKKWFGDKNKSETMASNAATIERGSNAYLQTYAAMLNPFMTNAMYSDLLDARYNSYGNMHVSWKSKSRGGLAGVFGGKNYSDTTPQKTFDIIQAMEDAVEAIKDYNTKEEKRLDLLSAQGYGYSVLSQQVNALSDAVDRANWMNDSYSINWTGGEHFEIDLSDNIQDLKKAYYEALREYGSETANRSNTASSTFLSLFPYLNSYSWYGMRDVGWGYTDISNPLSALNYVTNASNSFADRNANRQLFDIVSSAGYNQFKMQSLQYSDPLAYTEQYLTILERSRDAAELVMQKQQEIYFDATKTFEEQSAALEMYQQAQDQYYNSKLEILAQEQAKQEQIKKQEQQMNLLAAERMEALLGFSGEMARTGNKIYILEGADQVGALEELLQQSRDNPEAVAAIKAMINAANNQNKFGKIA